MQSKRSNSNISFRRLSSGGSISSTSSEYFNRRAMKNDFERIFLQWSAACEAEGLQIPKNAVAEFKKRIGQAGRLGEKAKLNLSFSALDDKRLVALIECLAQKPLIAKLDLRGNELTDESVKVIVKLLKGQLRLVKEIEKDKRLTVSFLGEVSLEHNTKELDQKLLKKIVHMCDALKIVNAHAFIRSKYLESHAPDIILSPFLIKMWFDVVGKLDHDRISKAFSNSNISERSTLGYEELEKILTQGLVLRGALPSLNEEAFKTIRMEKASRRSNNFTEEDELQDLLIRELNSIPAYSKPVNEEPSQGSDLPQLDSMAGKDDSSSVTEIEANSATELIEREDSKDSILSNDEVIPFLDQASDDNIFSIGAAKTSIPFMASVPTFMSPYPPIAPKAPTSPQQSEHKVYFASDEVTITDDVLESQNEHRSFEEQRAETEMIEESVEDKDSEIQIAEPVDESKVFETPKDSGTMQISEDFITHIVDQEHVQSDETIEKRTLPLVEETYSPKTFDKPAVTQHLSDFSIPQIESISRLTTVDDEEAGGTAGRVGSYDSQRKLSDLFDEIDEVFSSSNQQKHQDTDGGNVEGEFNAQSQLMKALAPKPPINIPSKYINLPRKGSNLYEDSVLELPNRNLSLVRFSEYLSPNRYRMLKVLILRNNRINTLSSLQLFQLLPNVTDLDLAYNELHHRILDIDLPRRIQRLDLSHNQLTDISGIMTCVDLRELNVSHNQIKALYGLPVKLTRLDISNNRIQTVSSLRSLSICVALVSIYVKNNHVVKQLPNVKVFLRSVMPNLQEIDGVKVSVGLLSEKKKSIDSTTSLMKSLPPSPKATLEEQKLQDSIRANQVLAKQKLVAASKSVIDEYINETNKSKKLKPDEVDCLTKRLYAPRGSPNDPRKYVTKVVPPKKIRRHSGDGKNGTQTDSTIIIDEWLSKASIQFDRIVKAFRTAKSFIRLEGIKATDLELFTALVEDIQSQRLTDINLLLKSCTDQKYREHEKLNEIPKMQEDIEKSILILQQIQTITLFCIDNTITFADGMDLIMGSKAGQYVNDNVLRLYNCYYEINYNYLDFVTRQASTRSISNEGFTYDVRDEFVADNPMVNSEDRRRSSMISILSKSSEANPMDRVRNRVMTKYLPPEVILDISLDNNDLQFAEHNPMKVKRSPLRNSVMTEEIINEVMVNVNQLDEKLQTRGKESYAESAMPSVAAPVDTALGSTSFIPLATAVQSRAAERGKSNNEYALSLTVEATVSNVTATEQKDSKVNAQTAVTEQLILPKTITAGDSIKAEEVRAKTVALSVSTSSLNVAAPKEVALASKSPISSPLKSPKSAASPLLKPASFKRSIEKITKKLSTKENEDTTVTSSAAKTEEKKVEQLSAKERLQRRMCSNKTKVEGVLSPSTSKPLEEPYSDPIVDSKEIVTTEIDDCHEGSTPLIQKAVSQDSGSKVSLQVQTDVITVGSPTFGSKRSPAASPKLSPKPSSGPNSRSSTPTNIPKLSGSGSDSELSPKLKNKVAEPLAGFVDFSKLNAKDRLRLRMEKNKKTT